MTLDDCGNGQFIQIFKVTLKMGGRAPTLITLKLSKQQHPRPPRRKLFGDWIQFYIMFRHHRLSPFFELRCFACTLHPTVGFSKKGGEGGGNVVDDLNRVKSSLYWFKTKWKKTG